MEGQKSLEVLEELSKLKETSRQLRQCDISGNLHPLYATLPVSSCSKPIQLSHGVAVMDSSTSSSVSASNMSKKERVTLGSIMQQPSLQTEV